MAKSFLVGSLLVAFSCSEGDDIPGNHVVVSHDLVNVGLFIENEQGAPPTADGETLYEIREHNPVMDLEGRHLTLAEFNSVKGTVAIDARENGTLVTLNLSGLIPNALYTVWNVTFKEPGFDPGAEDLNIAGVGTLGLNDGSQNTFRASAEGSGSISALNPPGPLSMQGSIAKHPHLEEIEWHIVGAYHMDDKSHGPDLGPDGTVVEQFAFIFKP